MESENQAGEDELAKLVATCLEDFATGGPKAVQGFLDANPGHADKLRESLRSLAEFGLLEGSEQIPEKFGHYTILGRLGRGGMSEVFLAFDPRMKREVALKCAHPGLALEARAQQRFQREVEAVAKLVHAGIVPVYDAGEANGRAYFTMEYARGATLSDLIKLMRDNQVDKQQPRNRLIAQAVDATDIESHIWKRPYIEIVGRWILDLAEALEHAHAAGVVHRDVTPANVIVRQDGRAQLFDFGLAMLKDAPSLTMFGEFTGTPYYVSPEQLSRKAGQSDGDGSLDERCDIYSLGVTLFELLTLRRPFEGASTAEVLSRIQNGEARTPRHFNPQIPRDLELICLTALDRDRKRRYQSMSLLAADLRSFLNFEPVSARPIGRAERTVRFIKRRPAIAATLTLSAILFLGVPPILLGMNATIRRERDAANASALRAIDLADQATESAETARHSAELANQSAHRANRIAFEFEEFLSGLFDRERMGTRNLTVEQLVSRGIERLARVSSDDDLLVELALLEATGRVFSKMGQVEQAQKQLHQVFVQKRDLPSIVPDERAMAAFNYATSLLDGGLASRAHNVLTQASSQLSSTPGNAGLRANMLLAAALSDQARGNAPEATGHLNEALAIHDRAVNQSHEFRFRMASREATVAEAAGRHELALQTLERALQDSLSQWKPEPTKLTYLRTSLARVADYMGTAALESKRHKQQIQHAEQQAQRWAKSLSIPPPGIPIDVNSGWRAESNIVFNQALEALKAGETDRTIRLFQEALNLHPRDPLVAYNMYCATIEAGRTDEAHMWLQRAIEYGYGTSPKPAGPLAHNADFARIIGDPLFSDLIAQIEAAAARPLAMSVLSTASPSAVLIYITPTNVQSAESERLLQMARALGWTMLSITPRNRGGPGSPGWLANQGSYQYETEHTTDEIVQRLRPEIDAVLRDGVSQRVPFIVTSSGDSGPFATHFAIRYAGLIDALVLLDSFPGPEPRTGSMQDAAISGLTIAVVDEPGIDVEWVAAGVTQREFSASVATWFDALAFDTRSFPAIGAAGSPNESGEDLQSVFAATLERVHALR